MSQQTPAQKFDARVRTIVREELNHALQGIYARIDAATMTRVDELFTAPQAPSQPQQPANTADTTKKSGSRKGPGRPKGSGNKKKGGNTGNQTPTAPPQINATNAQVVDGQQPPAPPQG